MWVIDVELDRTKEVLNSVVLDVGSVNKIFVLSTNDNLPGNGYFFIVLIPHWRLRFVLVVKGYSHGGFGNAGLAIFVN